MPTHASPLVGQPWSHDWGYEVVDYWGDPDYDPTSGVFVTINASSDVEAEHRALTYLIHNFEDPTRHAASATSEGAVGPAEGGSEGESTYRVRIAFPRI